MCDASWVLTTLPDRGRGLVASRAIKPGEVVLREEAAAYVSESGATTADQCHGIIAQIIIASRSEPAIDALESHVDRFRATASDSELLHQVRLTATPAIRTLLGSHADACTEEAVERAYCTHLTNSMYVLAADSLAPVGMGLFPRHGAMVNHSNDPNCWTMFEAGRRPTLVLRHGSQRFDPALRGRGRGGARGGHRR